MNTKPNEAKSAGVPAERPATQDEDIDGRWPWVERPVWSPRMLRALEYGVRGGKWYAMAKCLLREARVVQSVQRSCLGRSISLSYQLENRTRENRTSGSEGGVALITPSLPLSIRGRLSQVCDGVLQSSGAAT